jgi:lipopolysaccharide/colanic/teichoic acid biosynthesis glycosyltransferase
MSNILKQRVIMKELYFPINNGLASLDELKFKNYIKYERLRTDREKGCFSLILFNIKKENDKSATLILNLNKIKRKIDLIGWFKDGFLGLLLPLTDHEGAMNIYHTIKENIPDKNISLTVYSYPSKPDRRNSFTDERMCEVNVMEDQILKKLDLRTISAAEDIEDDIMSAFVEKTPSWKRVFDIMVSAFLLLLLSPLFLLIAIYTKIVSPGPVIFKQKRVGYKKKTFDFYKFRTMHIKKDGEQLHQQHVAEMLNSDIPMTKLDIKNDPRIIKGGKILRASCIDELPQLVNVLKGEMSLVGPRPCLPYEEEKFMQWHKNRFDVLPGMTGLWQVSGKNKLSFNQMIRLDISYIKKLSLFLDVKILFLTIPTVIGLILEKITCKLNLQNKELQNYRQ